MNASSARALLLVTIVALAALGSPSMAHADARGISALPKVDWPKIKPPKADLTKFVPKVKFKAKGKLNKTTAKVSMYAQVSFAGKTHKISIFNMGIKKKGKAVKVERKIGKLKVALKVSWSGEREIIIKGTAKYLKFKVPVPRIRLRV